ncbi:MAG: ligase-associated DNA damage response endonuclease PdeM [Casimicrobiaceae bacterium]
MTEITLGSEMLVALAERALWWPRTRTLFVADVHLGKAECLRAMGQMLPVGANQTDLDRISGLITVHAAKRLVILGDWVHGPASLTPGLDQALARFRTAHAGLECVLVLGNHDRNARVLGERWGFRVGPEGSVLDGITCWHEPPIGGVTVPSVSGHLHPAVALRARNERVTLPCFWRRGQLLVLPAFGQLTGTFQIDPAPEDEVILVAGKTLVRHSPASRRLA